MENIAPGDGPCLFTAAIKRLNRNGINDAALQG